MRSETIIFENVSALRQLEGYSTGFIVWSDGPIQRLQDGQSFAITNKATPEYLKQEESANTRILADLVKRVSKFEQGLKKTSKEKRESKVTPEERKALTMKLGAAESRALEMDRNTQTNSGGKAQMQNAAQLTNTTILLFICGNQGGTIHQLVNDLNSVKHPFVKFDKPITADDVINAGYDEMHDLMRQAQMVRMDTEFKRKAKAPLDTAESTMRLKDPKPKA